MALNRVVIVGAGMGGLAAALDLAAQGLHVTVLERAAAPGGKMRQVMAGGAAMDAGPTVFTMRHVFEALFARAGADFSQHVRLNPLAILARHGWTDGSRLDLHADLATATEAIAAFAGRAEAERFGLFAAESRAVFQLLDRSFMRADKPSMLGLIGQIVARERRSPLELFKLRPFETLWRALGRSFRDPRLRQLFGRYATYVGSSPFAAPATLMLIAHAEQDGVWAVEGGMHALARAIHDLAAAKGAQFRFQSEAARLVVGPRGVEGVDLADGERVPAERVIFNGDYAALSAGLLGEPARAATPTPQRERRSLSAIVACRHVETSGFPMIRHNVFFSADYPAEFRQIFSEGRPPDAPTVYICAQDRDDDGLPEPGPERLLCLINAPAHGDVRPYDDKEIARCEENAARLMAACGLTLNPGPATITTPAGFHALFPATGGGLYGQATHGSQASFRRPGAVTAIPGLYLAGGSVHPGPGVPMAALSGSLAAARVLADLTSPRPSRPAAIAGGMSTR
jgi:1-hydroxycarotenoid 3,4-desaturase